MKKLLTLLVVFGFMFAFVACDNTAKKEDAGEATEEVVEDAEDAAEDAGESIEEGAEEVGDEVDSAVNAE